VCVARNVSAEWVHQRMACGDRRSYYSVIQLQLSDGSELKRLATKSLRLRLKGCLELKTATASSSQNQK